MTFVRLPNFVLFAAGLLCCSVGMRFLVADIAAWQASQFIDDWTERQAVASEQAWSVAEAAAKRAIAVAPVAMAVHYERLGRIHEWRHIHLPFGNEAAVDSRLAARDAYRQALELRPLWPYTWARLAYTKLRLLQIDDEFEHALRQAVELGPWRIAVNKAVVEIGLIAWLELDSAQRILVLDAAERTLKQNRRVGREVLALAKTLHRLDDICGALDIELAEAWKECAL